MVDPTEGGPVMDAMRLSLQADRVQAVDDIITILRASPRPQDPALKRIIDDRISISDVLDYLLQKGVL